LSRKTFAAATVTVNRRAGRPVGSKIESRIGTFELPHWPSRIRNVTEEPAMGLIVVETDSGDKRFFGPEDALCESRAGGSAGGHDPRAHGKIRYIVRAFGKWAQGKHEVCVRRIRTEHPEVAKGRNVNALCAWLKDQWAGTTKWRGKKSDPKQRAEGEAIMKRASATAYARFTHSMPVALDDEALDALVEDVRTMTGIEPADVLAELGGTLRGDVFEALWEAEVNAYRTEPNGPLLEILTHGPEKSYVRPVGSDDPIGSSVNTSSVSPTHPSIFVLPYNDNEE
jgi:hypothetical protein